MTNQMTPGAASRRPIRLLLALAVLAASPAVPAADGEALYAGKGCLACHGPAGEKPLLPGYPRLAGQDRAYLVQQLKDIRDGKRTNGQTAVMKPVVKPLSDDEVGAIADYLSRGR